MPLPIFDFDGQPFGPLDCSDARLQRGNLLELYLPPSFSLITMRFMIGGCSAAGSLDSNRTLSPAGLLALAGFTSALNVTVTAANAADASMATIAPTPSTAISFLRKIAPPPIAGAWG